MDCPDCGTEMVPFAVPTEAREAAPGDAAAICPACLALVEADAAADLDADPDFPRIVEGFPAGEAGAVMAVAVGLLAESVVLNRETVARLLEQVQGSGEDPWLVLERLAASPTVRSGADLGRASRQLAQLLDSDP